MAKMEHDQQLKELQNVFVQEADGILVEAEETLLLLEKDGFQIELVNKAFRLAHNFKGSARSVGFLELGELAHKYEDVLSLIKSQTIGLVPELITALLAVNDALKKAIADFSDRGTIEMDPRYHISILEKFLQETAKKTGENLDLGYGVFEDATTQFGQKKNEKDTFPPMNSQNAENIAVNRKEKNEGKAVKNSQSEFHRVSSDRLERLFNVIGEVVVNQSILDDCAQRDDTSSSIARQAIGYMSKLVGELQNSTLSMRMVPIKPLFQKLRRTARDVSESLNKEVSFVDEGEHCELDKTIADKIADPLNHMIRNAIDHGVDSKDERIASGKNPVATVKFIVQIQDEQVRIVISDDGRGLNKEKIFQKALASGLIKPGKILPEEEIYALIFAPGFSTKDQVTDVSGRGVGMEVVQKTVEDLKGSIKITSKQGSGTNFEIALPLSLSIIAGMVVSAGGNPYVVPVSQLVETIEINKHQVEKVNGQARVINLRGEIMPVYDLSQILACGPKKSSPRDTHGGSKTGLVTLSNGRKITIEVDSIINQQKVVLKQLGREFAGMPGIVAGAVLRNGEPSLVINPDKFINLIN